MTGTLPVLDLARFRSADRDAFLDDLRRAAREVGFFTVVGHGIPRELTERLGAEVRRLSCSRVGTTRASRSGTAVHRTW